MTTKTMYAERHNKEKRLLLSLCFGLLLTFMSLNEKANEYLLPQSDSVYLTDVDIAGFSLQKLNYARNEIYARHGRIMGTEFLVFLVSLVDVKIF